ASLMASFTGSGRASRTLGSGTAASPQPLIPSTQTMLVAALERDELLRRGPCIGRGDRGRERRSIGTPGRPRHARWQVRTRRCPRRDTDGLNIHARCSQCLIQGEEDVVVAAARHSAGPLAVVEAAL